MTNLHTKESFSYWATNPADTILSDVPHLEEAVSQYPYCQILHLLLSKAVNMHEPERTGEVLHRTATHSLNRKALRKLILNEFEWSDSLLAKQLSSIFPSEYQKESYISFKTKKLELPDLSKLALIDFDEIATRPPIDDSTLRENVLQSDLEKMRGVENDRLETERQLQMDIIDSFIEKEMKLGPFRVNRNDLTEQEDLIKKRAGETPKTGIISEGMAKILVRQGKIEKAIEMYEQLLLKKPEKSTYFAEKIKELSEE